MGGEVHPIAFQPTETNEQFGKYIFEIGAWPRYSALREVAMDSDFAQITAELLDSTRINFCGDTSFARTAGISPQTPFHNDNAGFKLSGDKACIAWIALDQSVKGAGSMIFLKGSHKQDKKQIGERAVLIALKSGDVVFCHNKTMRAFGPSESENNSFRGISFRYCGDDVSLARRSSQSQSYQGRTDILYSRDYPLVWPRPYPQAKISRLYE